MKHANGSAAPGSTRTARVLTWSEDGTARVWETASGKALSEPMKHPKGVTGARFDKDGTRVLTWSEDGTARVWGDAFPDGVPRDLLSAGSRSIPERG